jgi:bifunctional oligoribonuclease and PAP phosphatase NrnA
MRKEFDACREIFQQKQRFVLSTHVNPDPDAIGSEIALAAFLRSRGKDVTILNHSATPANCLFLDPQGTISQFVPERHARVIANTEVVVVLDANQSERLQSLHPYVMQSKAMKLCIDHHLERQPFADLYVIDEEAAATGEILYNLLLHCDPESVTKEIATALYAAIMTDTGSFRFPKTDAVLHRVVAGLIERGADPMQIYHEIYEQGSAKRLQLLGGVLSTLQLAHEGRVASVFVTRAMFDKTETTEEDTENFVTYMLSIAGVQIGLMFTELAEGVKISFRSRGEIAVNILAQEFGGNGHKNAAGARTTTRELEGVLQEVVERSKTYLV